VIKHRQWIAIAICVVMALSMFVSSAYIAHVVAHGHDCTGDNCPVCRFIAQVEQLRRGFGILLAALLLTCLAPASRREWYGAGTVALPTLVTLVGRKIRLND